TVARNLLEIQDVALKVAVSEEDGMERSTLTGTLARLHATDHQVETAQHTRKRFANPRRHDVESLILSRIWRAKGWRTTRQKCKTGRFQKQPNRGCPVPVNGRQDWGCKKMK